ncbi:MAG TPA: helix-turn-helix domain-containing protein [Gemmatimonadales bacterium]|nr:helix-turn-helix domain-containing protein [Gemmatimonadales bacterium]
MSGLSLDPYVVDVLLPDLVGHDHRPSAFLVYLFLARHAERGAPVRVSLRALAEGTGLSKRGVQSALRVLVRRRLLRTRRSGPTATPEYLVQRPWAERR